MEDALRFSNMAERFATGQSREFWSDVAKMKGNSSETPSNVGGRTGDDDIADLFREKYSALYSSVGFDAHVLQNSVSEFAARVADHSSQCTAHVISTDDVDQAVRKLKRNKHDGLRGLYTDHLKNAPRSLLCHLSWLFGSLLSHGVSPTDFGLSTMVPIPKSKLKSKSDPENYRSIALSSILNKVLDKVFIRKCKQSFATSDYQFGFKEQHSTVQCSFVVNEVVQHYVSNDSTVYACLLDATKAFDRIAYCKLFRLLLDRSVCPVIIRFLQHL